MKPHPQEHNRTRINMGTPDEVYIRRQSALMDSFNDRSIVIIPTNPNRTRSRDVHYPFRASSDMIYLTGCLQEECTLILSKIEGKMTSKLFVQPNDTLQEIWTGRRPGIEGSRSHAVDDVDSNVNLINFLNNIRDSVNTISYVIGQRQDLDEWVNDAVYTETRARQKSGVGPKMITDPRPHLSELRLRKDDYEMESMEKAANIAVKAHKDAMIKSAPGMNECEYQGIIEGCFLSHGSCWSYPSIVAGGDNATILHYHANNAILKEGDLLLIDAGCEVDGYASDVTRTFPVNGHFTNSQREIYQAVLDAQRAAIATCKVGELVTAPNDAARKVLSEHLIRLGIIDESMDEPTGPNGVGRWFMHGIGHWLGLDVHDVGVYSIDDSPREFEHGMVITIEPGLYFASWRTDVDVPEKYAGIGVRIEDNILITNDGPVNLTEACPVEIDDIESLMNGD